MNRKQRHLDFELFKKSIDEIAIYGSAIRFIGFSEPFLYPHIIEAIEYVKSKNLLLHITNNGTVINEKHIQAVIDNSVDSMIFSMQGVTQEEYSIIRDTDKYYKLIENIKKLYTSRKSDKPFIKLSTSITNRDREKDIEEFKNIHKAYADVVQVTGYTSFSRVERDFDRLDIVQNLKIDKPTLSNVTKCTNPNFEMLINANGIISPCCDDSDELMSIGDISKNTLYDIWHNEEAKYYREMTMAGKFDDIDNCKNCHIRYIYNTLEDTING
jgi:radical SAM protein with 4Fe4S-binding SPASM domain